MKKNLLILTALLSIHLVYSQNRANDSLEKLLAAATNDSERISVLGSLAWVNTWSSPEHALELARQQLLLARKAGLGQAEADALASNAIVLSVLGDYSHAIDYYLQSIKLSEKLKYTNGLLLGYLNISETYSDAGDHNNAVRYAYKGKSIIDTMSLGNTGAFLKRMQMLTWTYIGEAYEKFGQLDSAFLYLRKARAIDSTYLDKQSGFTTLHLAGTYAKNNQPPDAIKYYRETIALSILHVYNSDLMDAYNGLARVFSRRGQSDSAIFYANQTVLLGKSTAYPLAILNAVTLLSDIYKSKNNLDSAVEYMGRSIMIKDSLFNREKVREVQNVSFSEQLHQQELQQRVKQNELQYRNRLNVYILFAGVIILSLAAVGLWRRNVYKQKSFALLQKQKREIDVQKERVEKTLEELKSTQAQLIQSEKMASLGELTAGIAHEIQNPLNFVNNFSEVNKELIQEWKKQRERERGLRNEDWEKEIINDIEANEEKINHHGRRAEAIVKGMLQHSRTSSGQKEPTDLNGLADEYLRLTYQGLRARDKSFNAEIKTDFDASIGQIHTVRQDIGRVILNVINNAFYAVSEKAKENIAGYAPKVTVATRKVNDRVELRVNDNGNGIPQKLLDKIFQPFFTTKPTGQGTGLGLSLGYDIVKAHGGEIRVETTEGEGSEFIVQLPIQ